MKRDYFNSAALLALSAIVVYLFYLVMAPFFAPLAYAGILAIVFRPLYRRLLVRLKSPSLTAGVMCVVVTVVIVAPLAYLIITLASEAKQGLEYLNELYTSGQLQTQLESVRIPGLEALKAILSRYGNLETLRIDALIANAVSTISAVVGSQFTNTLANIAQTIFYFFMTLNALFFFFRDGDMIVSQLERISPLPTTQTRDTFQELKNVVEATIFGGVVVALMQGVLGGLLFAIVGLPSPVFWGAVMGFLSFLPIVGSFLVFIPAGVYLILTGSLIKGLIVISVGVVVISQLDNFVRPILIAGKTSLHTLLLFFSILGGIALFGLLGIVLGPVIAAVMVTVAQIIYRATGDANEWMAKDPGA